MNIPIRGSASNKDDPRFCVLWAELFVSQTTSYSIIAHLGRMIFSLGCSEAKSLKVLNLTEGGWRKGLAPKLNSHCWYDIKLAAAKKPDLGGKERTKRIHLWASVCEGQRKELRNDSKQHWNKRSSTTLTWPRRRPAFLVAADVRSDRRSSASCWGPRGSR